MPHWLESTSGVDFVCCCKMAPSVPMDFPFLIASVGAGKYE
jgi:hypothetical protein